MKESDRILEIILTWIKESSGMILDTIIIYNF